MIRILITGANSYIGTSLAEWLGKHPNGYTLETMSLRDDRWKWEDFSKYDVVIHVAGVAHIKETKENESLYYKINRDLAFSIAKKSKTDGVKQFVFLSSMSVYGIVNGVIDENTPLMPDSHYGKSKLQAEELLEPLNDNYFRVAILRPPMVYGKKCKGNYSKLAKLAVRIPIFPDIDNKRSMIYIDNLSEFIKLVIDNSCSGIFFPQNNDYVKTSEMVRQIIKAHGKKVWLTKLFNPLLRIFKIGMVNKVFGDLVYDKELSKHSNIGNRYFKNFEESINQTEIEK